MMRMRPMLRCFRTQHMCSCHLFASVCSCCNLTDVLTIIQMIDFYDALQEIWWNFFLVCKRSFVLPTSFPVHVREFSDPGHSQVPAATTVTELFEQISSADVPQVLDAPGPMQSSLQLSWRSGTLFFYIPAHDISLAVVRVRSSWVEECEVCSFNPACWPAWPQAPIAALAHFFCDSGVCWLPPYFSS